MLWMNAFPADPAHRVDPADPAENFGRLDSMRLHGTSPAFARNPKSISIKIEEFIVRKPWKGSWEEGEFEGQDSPWSVGERSHPNMPELLGCPARSKLIQPSV